MAAVSLLCAWLAVLSGVCASSSLLSEIPAIPELPDCSESALNAAADGTSDSLLGECLRSQASTLQPWGVSVRRILHRRPELMYEEFETSAVVQHVLKVCPPQKAGPGVGVDLRRFLLLLVR